MVHGRLGSPDTSGVTLEVPSPDSSTARSSPFLTTPAPGSGSKRGEEDPKDVKTTKSTSEEPVGRDYRGFRPGTRCRDGSQGLGLQVDHRVRVVRVVWGFSSGGEKVVRRGRGPWTWGWVLEGVEKRDGGKGRRLVDGQGQVRWRS